MIILCVISTHGELMPKHVVSGLNYLAAARLREKGYLQKEIAESLKINRSTVSHYLNGRNLSWNSIEVAEVIINLCPEDFLKLTHALTRDTDKTRIIIKTLLDRKFRASVRDTCIGCGMCVDTCLMKAVALVDLKAQIDSNWCCGCRICEVGCPTNSIEILEVEDDTNNEEY